MSDKRSVATDALATLGTIIGPNEKRDAIHLAVIPVKAGAPLVAGMYINLENGVAMPSNTGLGIVDPFVAGEIHEGQHFWMVLRPRTITSLRHVWSHPALPDEPGTTQTTVVGSTQSISEVRLREIAESVGLSLGRLLDGANEFLDGDGWDYIVGGSEMEGMSTPEDFWDHFTTFTGRVVPMEKRRSFFSCSC